LIRLVRLLRVVAVCWLFTKEKKSELDEIGQAITDSNTGEHGAPGHDQGATRQKDAGDQTKKVEASRLGKILSEQTTRTVIIGVR
jgi:hypothetical protein